MPRTQKVAEGVATIDVALVVIRTGTEDNGFEIALDTANQIQVSTQTETTEPIRLMKLGRLLAQKLGSTTITGHQITLTDNLFYPELMYILQGGTYNPSDDETGKPHYEPPAAGSVEKGQIFDMDCYSARYDASGQIIEYERITYPNCQGTPVTINTQDDVFRLPEYVINSAPKTGQAPYSIDYVDSLPDFKGVNEMSDEYQVEDEGMRAANMPSVMSSTNTTKVVKKSE